MRLPEDLLEQAQHLARREPRRPRQASLRRAISTGYYALFHLLILEATLNWKRPGDRAAFARVFEHTSLKNACVQRRDELNRYFKTRPSPSRQLTAIQHLYVIAVTFIRIQEEREDADYNYSVTWTRTEVASLIDSVITAFDAWKSIRDEDVAQEFLFTLLSKRRR